MFSRLLVLFFFLIATNTAFAQEDCAKFKEAKGEYKDAQKSQDECNNACDLKEMLKRHQIFSSKALVTGGYFESCFAAQGLADSDKKSLLSWYKLGNYFTDGMAWTKAINYYNKCLEHPSIADNFKVGSEQVKINLAYCKDGRGDGYERSYTVTRTLRYSGKGDLAQKVINEIGSDKLIDDRPYTTKELSKLGLRNSRGNEIAKTAEKLEAFGEVTVREPFIIVWKNHESTVETGNEGGQKTVEKNAPFVGQIEEGSTSAEGIGTDAPVATNGKYFYKHIIQPTAKHLQSKYFDKLQPDWSIPVFLFNSTYDANGYLDFSDYCQHVHLRKCGLRVAYYLPIDNSIMIWNNTGGQTVNHELVHALMKADFPTAPAWISEGLASMHEEMAGITYLDNFRLIYLQKGYAKYSCMLSLDTLVSLSERAFNRSEAYSFYSAASRYFCLFLDSNSILETVYKQMRGGMDGKEAVEKAMGKSLVELQTEWENWVVVRDVPEKWQAQREVVAEFMKTFEQPLWQCK